MIRYYIYTMYYKSCIAHALLPIILHDEISIATFRFIDKQNVYTSFLTKAFRGYSKSSLIRIFILLYLGRKGRREYKQFLKILDKYRVNEFTTFRKYVAGLIFDPSVTWRWKLALLLMTKEERQWVLDTVMLGCRRNYHKKFIAKYNYTYCINESKSTVEQVKQMELEEAYYKRFLTRLNH